MDLRLTSAIFLWCLLFAIALHRAFSKTECTGSAWWRSFFVFMATLSVAFPVWRLRSLLYNGEINVDESQFLAQLLRYKTDPIPWRGVDGGSSGPLNTWVLLWAPLLGLKVGYFAARVTGLLCLWSTCCGLALALAEIAGRRLALLLTLPAVTLLLTSLNLDYLFFSSEQLPIAFIAWTVFFLARQATQPTRLLAYGIGLLTGAMPFCKIQIGPGAVFLWIVGAGILWFQFQASRDFWRFLLSQILGGLTVPALILAPVIFVGAWREFFDLYLKAATGYKSPGAGSSALQTPTLMQLIQGVPEFYAFVIVTLGLLSLFAVLLVLKPRAVSRGRWAALASILGFAAVVGYSVSRSGYAFPHYTILLIPCVTLLGAVTVLFLGDDKTAPPIWVYAAAGLLIPFVQGYRAFREATAHPQFLGDWGSGVHPVGAVLAQHAREGQSMFVWGYAPKFYVITGFVPASRFMETISTLTLPPEAESDPNSNLSRLVRDLEKSKPELFVDAPDEFWFPSPTIPRGIAARHHNVPVISRFVSSYYKPVLQINIGPQKVPIIIYKRKSDI
ncbi:MAG: hypothetical protein EBS01_00665 [Verrucomicrobia bacterium]|nr:hypothetical protein [Verrucomicrobiota bacterium]